VRANCLLDDGPISTGVRKATVWHKHSHQHQAVATRTNQLAHGGRAALHEVSSLSPGLIDTALNHTMASSHDQACSQHPPPTG